MLLERAQRRDKEKRARLLDQKMTSMLAGMASKSLERFPSLEPNQHELDMKKREETRQLRMRQNRYAEMVKEMYVPKVDKVKRLEVELKKM
jgi:hypothetical protein